MAEREVGDRSHLRGWIEVLSRRRVVIAVAALIGAGLAVAGTFATRPSYSAGAVVLVPSPAAGSPQRTLADELQLARGDAVRKGAVSALGYQAAVTVSSSATADVLIFTAHGTDRGQVAAIANAYAGAFITQQRADLRTALPPAAVVKAAVTPASATAGTVTRNGVVGFLAGAVAGLAIAFLVDHLDEAITSRRVAERSCGGRPVLGLIPNVRSWRRRRTALALTEDPASGPAEAYRTLGTAVRFVGSGAPTRVVAVTSPGAGEGKTTVVANLAVCFARAGRRVIVLSADLRRPRVHDFFGLANDTGLTSLFGGQDKLPDVLLPVPGEPRLRVMPSGPLPPNPAEILSAAGMRQLCGVLRENADLVLIDCPPVLPVTDALLVAKMVDSVLLVASVSSTTRTELERAFEMLDLVGAPVVGTVLNRVPTRGPRASRFGCAFGGANQAAGPPVSTPPAQSGPVPETSGPSRATVDLRSSRRNGSGPSRPKTARAEPRRRIDYSHEFTPPKARSK
jgi:capsular exopolysaccharide synthesis family protein